MGRKCWSSFLQVMGMLAVTFIVLSLIFPNATQIRHLHLSVCVLVPIYLFSFFTFELKLFSRYLWCRRAIVIFFSALTMTVVNFIFDYLRGERTHFLILLGVILLTFAPVLVLTYYVSDKIEEQNLKKINQKLADGNAKNMK